MVLRVLAMAGGLAGAVGFSQFPEFSQQYAQRLGGAVDEMSAIVQKYETDAAQAGLSLDAYIQSLSQEGPLSQTQATNMSTHVQRHSYLVSAQEALNGAGPFMRARLAGYMGDQDVAKQAFDDFKPALPATFEGAVFAGTGFLGGWLSLSAVFALLTGLWTSVTGIFRKRAT
ncbi:MAG: DUF2937 family protein [Pelagimonas sp.]|uniref:DUF2937 family protein n=1 Tax=Pelagimonas sp. TaxID=2073170 RepID=UPI003D6AD2B2